MKGIIFDLDGVIVSTDKYHYLAWKQLADKLGIYFDEKINERLRGVSRMESLDIVLEKYSGTPFTEEEKISFAEEKNQIYRNYLKNMQPQDVGNDVRETLKSLHNSGYLLAIGSSSKNAKFILERTETVGLFDAISDGNNIVKSKPDPEVFIKAAEFLNLENKDCAVVEDAEAGIAAAKAAGMRAIGIGSFTEGTADYHIDRFEELVEAVK